MTVSLCIDIDASTLGASWLDRWRWCCSVWRWRPVVVRFDRTRRGWHIVATATAPAGTPAMQLVAAQAILGSDPNREAFNVMRAASLGSVPPFWRSRWNVLYERHSRPSSRGSVRRGTRQRRRLEKAGD